MQYRENATGNVHEEYGVGDWSTGVVAVRLRIKTGGHVAQVLH